MQKAVFYAPKGGLSQAKRPPFANALIINAIATDRKRRLEIVKKDIFSRKNGLTYEGKK